MNMYSVMGGVIIIGESRKHIDEAKAPAGDAGPEAEISMDRQGE